MLAPISWLKDYIDITLPPKTLGERLTEVGLGCEQIIKEGTDTILELEITPNRPDWLSLMGIAREVAAIEKKQVKYPTLKIDLNKKPTKTLPLTIEKNTKLSPRFTGVIIDGIEVKDSPQWLQDRLKKIGQRPINNIVDITNYVMLELGNPLHAFDYDKIEGHVMKITQAKGGESFKSVDGISYTLPKGAVIVKDKSTIIDLCGIKGGYNSGTFTETKRIFLWAPVEIPILIRRTSQALSLRSEASSIFERGVNKGGTIEALRRACDLILDLAGGVIASPMYDMKDEEFKPWKVSLRKKRLTKLLGIEIPENKIISIFQSLNFSPQSKGDTIECTIPTYRNDVKIEEDLIEEVARIYGYSNFPKTLPTGKIRTEPVPYAKDYGIDQMIKHVMTAAGFSEVYTYSLISEGEVKSMGFKPDSLLRVDNPVSRDYEYLRPSLKSNLVKAVKQNLPLTKDVQLFELGRVYHGKSIDKASEYVCLSGISTTKSYFEVKGILERLYQTLGVSGPTNSIETIEEGTFFEINMTELLQKPRQKKVFKPLPKYPPIIEDLAIVADEDVSTGELMDLISSQSKIIKDVSLLDQYEDTRTFHIIYQHQEKNLTNTEVGEIRKKILTSLKEKFNALPKE